ncbi:MAG: hypothetical protein ACTMIZ_03540, partial [Cellulosimicrobium funkei]
PAGVEGRFRRGEPGDRHRRSGPPTDGAYPAGSLAVDPAPQDARDGHGGALAGMPVDGGGLDVVGGGVEQVLF